jgi:hypothetical protein
MYSFPIDFVFGLIGSMKLRPHFTNGSNAIIGWSGPLPLHHISVSHWHISHVWHISVTSLFNVGH